MLGTAIALGSALLLTVYLVFRHGRLLWQWAICHAGPTVHPALWRFMHGAFPLALLALGIGIWLGLAATPGMAKLAPGPVEDVSRLAEWLTLIGVTGCVMRALNFAACRTLEHEATAPQPRKTSAPKKKTNVKKPAHTAAAKATAPSRASRKTTAKSTQRRRSTSRESGRAAKARRTSQA
ncbi:hypothetical protein DFO67_101171 [Modicisalibacter xianhensis]|uniref:Transmembrane protein n=1 Tax=Modicisalibacter xianhensis TaxID=442341 RepID=A0A4R8G078_9GAMM|nr:hypothetical protein DFO67_101171 [Halomonas xianhensis]